MREKNINLEKYIGTFFITYSSLAETLGFGFFFPQTCDLKNANTFKKKSYLKVN